MFIAGDQARDLGRASLNPAAVRRENSDAGSLARHDVHGVIDAFYVALREFLEAAKIVKGIPLRHRYSLPLSLREQAMLIEVILVL